MATIKSYTDLSQSKKLAEILPLQSADMYYLNSIVVKYQGALPIEFKHGNPLLSQEIAAWSLAALLEIIKKLVGYSLQSLDTHTVFMNCELGDKPYNIETENYNNPVDACVDMIEKLNELNLL